jgi:hypothetical protein
MKSVPFLFAAVVVLGCSPGRAADFKNTGPMAPSTALIAAHGAVQEPGLEFVYKIEGGAAPATVTFDLARDFSVVDAGDVLTIYDYALKRVIVLADKGHTYRNNSLYGLVDSLGSTGMDATFEPSKQAIGKDEGARLVKLLRANTPLAPAAIDRIVASGYLPQMLSFGSDKAAMTWTLQMSAAVRDAYPLASSARPPKPDPSDAQKALGEAFPAALAAIGGATKSQFLRTREDMRTAVETALADKHPFQALLLALDMQEEFGAGSDSCTGMQHCHSLKAIRAAAAHDPRTAKLLSALHPAKGLTKAAADTLAGLRRNDLDYAWMLDLYAARALAATGDRAGAQAKFALSIRANPYLPVPYRALGDFYRANSQPIPAWACYDLGRAVEGNATAPALAAVTGQEAQMEKARPELF